jgi:O-antigen/teichoic acid export membrane protein
VSPASGGGEVRHISGSIFSVGASRAATLVAVALTSIVITRLLGAAGIGTYAISFAMLFIFTVLFEIGLGQGTAYFAGRNEWGGTPLARGVIGYCLALAVPGAVAMLAGFALVGDVVPGMTWPMAVALALALPFSLLWRVGPQAALAQERFELFALFDSSPALLAFPISIAGALIADTAGAVVGLAMAMVLSGAGVATWLLAGSNRDQNPVHPPGGLRAVISFGSRAWGSELMQQINLRADLILVGAYAGAAQGGVYSIALSTTSIAWILTQAFAISALPRSARMHAASERDSADAARRDAGDARMMRHTVLVIPPVALGESLLLAVGIPLIYGSDFHRSIELGFILLPGSLVLGVGLAALAILLGRGRGSLVLRVGLAVVPATVIAYLLAAPSGGATAVAIISSASYLVYSVFAMVAMRFATGLSARSLLVPRASDVGDYRRALDRLVARGLSR